MALTNCVSSPLTGGSVSLECTINSTLIIDQYKEEFGLDVSPYFKDLNEVKIYLCNDTGYRFYYPYNLAGDGFFYTKLRENYSGYYTPWKWEHQQAASYIKHNMRVLEVGSGEGGFLKQIKEIYAANIIGLEINRSAVKHSLAQGQNVYCETIQEHAERNAGVYDVVCSFQVLEHIESVKAFLEAKISCLRKGGTLIICVPNNNSFIDIGDKRNTLNMPPHHMGLWNKHSLESLVRFFPLKKLCVKYEPLTERNRGWHRKIYLQYLKKRTNFILSRGVFKHLPVAISWRMQHFAPALYYDYLMPRKRGASIFISYVKTE